MAYGGGDCDGMADTESQREGAHSTWVPNNGDHGMHAGPEGFATM
eukprot:CAMPEP_0202899274 /NCGR_PEP_ID=MMETSP1392-20130828/7555_1 /ASSEMBLY_ACC=CAM_ASM_000868 /TAXON_ID=225041 /ORGANISM="Chlamydomonas chlamydogama, Strain SAG 11-48b" /LENGTH=44 /DNA_ID= /DNA_START= /DNA_END= /DNA_ORIENTATION=